MSADLLPQSSAVAACAAGIATAARIEALAAMRPRRAGWRAPCMPPRPAGPGDRRAVAPERPHHRARAGSDAGALSLAAGALVLAGAGLGRRLEQTLATDQDNGLIFSASDDGEARDLRELFLPFAQAANQALAQCGFPLCDGEVMAGNPRWCLSQSEWLESFSTWVRTPEPEALLNASIFFDFRPLAGDAGLAVELRGELGKLTRGNEIFLRMMTANALAAAPPLGRLRDFVTVPESGGTVDLKKVRLADFRRCGAHFRPGPGRRRDRRPASACARRPGWDNPACRCRGGGACLPCPARRAPGHPDVRQRGRHRPRQPDRSRNSMNSTADFCSKPCARRAACSSG
jgi:hypothetical protein